MVSFTPTGDALIQSRRFSGVRRWPVTRSDETLMPTASTQVGPTAPADLIRVQPETGDWWLLRFPTGEFIRWPGGRPEQEQHIFTKPGIDGPAVSPDGRLILVREFPRENVLVLETSGSREVARLPSGKTLSATFTPDGTRIITGTSREYRLWETGSWKQGPSWPAQIEGGAYPRADFSPDGRLVALGQERGVVEIRETQGYQTVLRLELPQKWWVNHFDWSPAGDRLYVLCPGHRLLYWDLTEIRRELAARGLNW